MNKQKGFTIIELIVVIAIIAVLAGIVLVNVTSYINKGKNAAIEGNMATLLTNAAAYFDQNSGSFGSTFVATTATGPGSGGTIETAVRNANGKTQPAITPYGDSASQAWCASAATLAQSNPTVAAGNWCVDSTGYKGSTNNCASAHFTCL